MPNVPLKYLDSGFKDPTIVSFAGYHTTYHDRPLIPGLGASIVLKEQLPFEYIMCICVCMLYSMYIYKRITAHALVIWHWPHLEKS